MDVDNYQNNMINIFKKRYINGLDTWKTEVALKDNVSELRQYIKDNSINKSTKIFEIGIGSGETASILLEDGHFLHGLDVYENEYWKILGKIWGDKVRFFTGDFFEFQPVEKYDVVFDNGCLHHQHPDLYKKFISRINNLLSNDGIFCLSVFFDFSDINSGKTVYTDGGKRICKYFSVSEISDIFFKEGFSVLSHKKMYRGFGSEYYLLIFFKKLTL